MNRSELSSSDRPTVVKSNPDKPTSKWMVHLPPPWNLPDSGIDHFLLRGADGSILWAGGTPRVIVLNEDGAFNIIADSQVKVYPRPPQIGALDSDAELVAKLEQFGQTDPAVYGPIINWGDFCPTVYQDIRANVLSFPPQFEIEDVLATAHGFEFKLRNPKSSLRIKVVVSTAPLGFISCSEM